MRWVPWGLGLAALAVTAGPAWAGCGCDKPPPPRAALRPFVAFARQPVAVIDERLALDQIYSVEFEPVVGGVARRASGRVRLRRDLADGRLRPHLRVALPPLALGPCRVSVWLEDTRLFDLPPDALTVTARPLALASGNAARRRQAYRAGVGSDGTIYIPVELRRISDATHFWGQGFGLPLDFEPSNIAMYNDQGVLMQLLDPTVPGLFEISPPGGEETSAVLGYWRHEFRTYKARHRQEEAFRTDDDENWHADGTRHVNHDLIVVAIRGRLTNGELLSPGATPPFTLAIVSETEER